MEIRTQTTYKDRLFRFIFGSKDNAANILSLYNALNGTEYNDPDELQITTLEDAIYIRMKNDVSFLISSYLTLWEQQSSYNPNMPLRGLMYFGELYSGYIETNELTLYGSRLLQIPTPQYVVFYNGERDTETVKKLRLSDSFINQDKSGDFEWTATMYNLNKENDGLLDACRPLKEYMTLVQYIRSNMGNGMTVERAVDEAVKRCIAENVMKAFLIKHRAEVCSMCITEYNEKTFVDGIRAEGIAEGIAEGMAKGMAKGMAEGKQKERNTLMEISDLLRKGKTGDELIQMGFNKDSVELALCLRK